MDLPKSNPKRPFESSSFSPSFPCATITQPTPLYVFSFWHLRRALVQSQVLRSTSSFSPLPPSSFQALSTRLTEGFHNGAFLKTPLKRDADGNVLEEQAVSKPPNPLADPGAMDGMMENMKKQAVMMVPNFLIMGWVRVSLLELTDHETGLIRCWLPFFIDQLLLFWFPSQRVLSFSLFLLWVYLISQSILVKLPFPLTHGFKSMLQRDIAAPDMGTFHLLSTLSSTSGLTAILSDVRWVSALSWYFLNWFGKCPSIYLLQPFSD